MVLKNYPRSRRLKLCLFLRVSTRSQAPLKPIYYYSLYLIILLLTLVILSVAIIGTITYTFSIQLSVLLLPYVQSEDVRH